MTPSPEPIATRGPNTPEPEPIRQLRPRVLGAPAPLAELIAAVAFLTRLPVGLAGVQPARTGAAAFALVGAGIGLVAALPILVAGARLPLAAAGLAVLVLLLSSGGLHLDGLADTADALAAPNPEAAERARTEPGTGPVGVAAIALDVLLSASLLAGLTSTSPQLAAAALVVATSVSRAAAPVAGWAVRRTRWAPPAGLAGWFTDRLRGIDVVAAIVSTVTVSAIAGWVIGQLTAVLIGVVVALAIAAVAGLLILRRRDRLDGDGLGAFVEITSIAVLAVLAVQLT